MTIVVGAAVAGPALALPSIGSIAFLPEGAPFVYRKRHLHPGEERYVDAGTRDSACLRHGDDSVALAICADTGQRAHAAAAAADGASLYLASSLISDAGYARDASALQASAAQCKMGVLLANHAAPSGGFASAGRSAFWNPDGDLVAGVDGPGNRLLIVDKRAGRWSGQVLSLDQ